MLCGNVGRVFQDSRTKVTGELNFYPYDIEKCLFYEKRNLG